MMSKRKLSKKTLWEQMRSSSIANKLMKILPVNKTKPIVCEHDRIDYKTLSILAKKQMNVIDVLAKHQLTLEKEKEVIRKAACNELDKLKAKNVELSHRLEVIKNAH